MCPRQGALVPKLTFPFVQFTVAGLGAKLAKRRCYNGMEDVMGPTVAFQSQGGRLPAAEIDYALPNTQGYDEVKYAGLAGN